MTDTTARGAGPAKRAQHAGEAGPAPARRRRMSAKRKQSAVLRLLRGEDLELVSREFGVMAAELTAWRVMADEWNGELAGEPPPDPPLRSIEAEASAKHIAHRDRLREVIDRGIDHSHDLLTAS